MFLYNYWYVAAMGHELGREPLARTLLNEEIVFYRKEDGTPVALEDRCVHRAAPLSLGRLNGDSLECGYHGLAFDCDGACVEVPGQSKVPADAKIRSYPVVENAQWVWIWMGDPAEADQGTVPDYAWTMTDDWALSHDLLDMDGNYQLLVDNLMDLSHLSFLHSRTIGVDDIAQSPITTERTEDDVSVSRWIRNCELAPMFAKTTDLEAKADRWSTSRFVAPANIIIEAGIVPVGAEKDDGKGVKHWVLNFITPRTDKSTHYFWGFARNYAKDDAEAGKLVYDQLVQTFDEDVEMIEGQQRIMDARPDAPTVDINVDSGPMQTRRLMQRLYEEEQAAGRRAA